MHQIEQAIQVFLENIESAKVDPKLIEEFGENCKKAITECLLVQRGEEPFTLRMSNIGKPLRQLMLEQKHGRTPMDAAQRLRMTYGYMWESFLFFLLKASNLNIETSKKVSLNINYGEGSLVVNGTMDLKIDGIIYDVKSASPWSFDNKFVNFDSVREDDPFGYVGQAMGYSIADKSRFGGWIVIDKSNGRIKVVEVPEQNYKALASSYRDEFKLKARTLTIGGELPPCNGVTEERFGKSATGHTILNKSCEFCSHKYLCHPELKFSQCLSSKAVNPKWKYYVSIDKPE